MKSMPSVMNHQFSKVPNAEIQRSTFDRSHGYKTTFDFGILIPIFVDEALPGDTFNLKMTAFGRLATPIHPVMDNMYLDYFFFAVPYRLVWDNWKKFNGEQINPGDSTSYVVPQMVAPAVTGFPEASIWDFYGVPTQKPGLSVSALPTRAYNLIWNEWFRDQNLQNSAVVDHGDGPDTYANYGLFRRGKRHDYFTSCLPWPQKGTAVPLPLGTRANVLGIGKRNQVFPSSTSVWQSDGTNPTWTNMAIVDPGGTNTELYIKGTAGTGGLPDIYADLSTATAATINQLRQAFQIQRLYERDARGGTRYTEILKAHFGVTSPDARLQRPEYLGGGTTSVSINPVTQTGATGATGTTTPQGNLAGFGTTSGNNIGFTKSFTEHCIIIGMVSGRADLNYQQGVDRMWTRSTRFDFYWPALSHIGEQSVLNKEIYAQGTAGGAADAAVFGYQERYAEYRYKPSRVTGQFRSNAATTLDSWHLAINYAGLPALNSTFIQDDPPVDRVIAVPSQPHMIFDSYFQFHCTRPMPTYSVPGMIDHF